MIKFILRLLYFLIITFLVYVLALNIIEESLTGPFKPNILYQAGDDLVSRKIKESDTIKDLDILFIGSSHAYDSFDPFLFEQNGITAYNWGTSQQSHPQTRMIFDKYLEKLNPKLVVYEVFPEIFNATGRESMADFLNAGEPFEVGFFDLFQYENSISLLNTYLIKRSRSIFGFNKRQEILEDNLDYYKGYVEKRANSSGNSEVTEIKWVPRKKQIIAFEENLKLLKDLGIPYVLVIAPFPFKYSNQGEITNYLSSRGKLYDYNSLLNFDSRKHFSDFHHMNHRGVSKMNYHFINELKKLEKFNFY